MQAPPPYHTSAEGEFSALERAARFLAFFLSALDEAPASAINP